MRPKIASLAVTILFLLTVSCTQPAEPTAAPTEAAAEPTAAPTEAPATATTAPSETESSEGAVSGIESIKVAIVDDFSGPVAEAASDQDFSFIFAVDELNANGGILGRQIEVIRYDDQNDPQQSVNFVRRAADEDEAILIVGGSSSSTTSANIPIVQELEIPYLIGAGAIVEFTEPPKEWVFRVGPHNADDAQALTEFLTTRDYERPAIMNSSFPYAFDGGNAVEEELNSIDFPPVAHVVYESESPDVTAQAIEVLQAEPDVVLLYALAADGGRVAETLREVGYTGDIVTPRIGLYDAFRETAGEAAEGVYVFNTVDPSRPEAQEFFEARAEEYGERPPTMYVALGYDMALIFFEALRHPDVQQALDNGDVAAAREALRVGFESIDQLEGIQGNPGAYYSYSEEKHHGLTGNWFSFLVIEDGEFQPIGEE